MFRLLLFLLAALPVCAANPIALVIHGGAGVITPDKMTPEKEKAVRETLTRALETGYAVLAEGGTSLEAVERVIVQLEDSPLFNAGKGAVFTASGVNELDASIMDGATLQAGAVAGVTRVKNPIVLAREVMRHSPHVMMVGKGAEAFGAERGIDFVSPKYFFTQERWNQLQEKKAAEKEGKKAPPSKHGTVGVVALDQAGNLAAGTSTGGLTNKRYGRVGDSPVIGAGTYADNGACAVSATGSGEYFIRLGVAADIAALVRYKGYDVERAAKVVIGEKLTQLGGDGGVIVLDAKGNHAMVFNTPGMYRGYMKQPGQPMVSIYGD